jgi:hypothetical protein
MAKKLIDQDEAARMLGVSVDELNSMRDRKLIYPKRDSGEWKYTQEEIDRVIADRDSGKSDAWGDKISLGDMSLDIDDPDAIDLSGAEGPPAESSTVIGKNREMGGPPPIPLGGSDVQLVSEPTSSSDVRLVSESGLKPGSSKKTGGSGLLDDLGGESTGSKIGSSGSLKLADEELNLAGSGAKKSGSDTRKGASDLHIASDEELVLDPAAGSDITIGGGDSGISLVDPADSGLSLEQPLELESSGAESLDLGEEDIISLEDDVAGDEATQLKSEDDFLLTPLEEPADEADSGSQVIALDSEEEFGAGFTPAPGMLEEDLGAGAPLVAGLGTTAALAGGAALAPAGYVVEPPYSVWNVLALIACFIFLFIGGMFTYDLMRHMWSWDQPYALNSGMMDSLVGLFE